MPRATIRDVALQAGISVATVNRVLHEPGKVRAETRDAILHAAETVGFYGAGTIRDRLLQGRPRLRLGFILLQRNRFLYKAIAQALATAAASVASHDVVIRIEHLDELSPQNVSDAMLRLADTVDLLGVVAAEHPTVSATIETLAARGVRVYALVSQLSARSTIGYIGIDMWKAGRTAGWAFNNLIHKPGKIGVLVGNHRYRCQETAESGFRSYMREHPAGHEILEADSTFETASIAQDVTERLLARHPDLAGLFINGGGSSGAIAALRDSGRGRDIVTVGFDLTDVTRSALLDGTLNVLMAQPVTRMAQEAVAAMIRAHDGGPAFPPESILLPFELYTPENL